MAKISRKARDTAVTACIAAGLLAVPAVHAAGWYGGISVGNFDDEIINGSDTGWKLYGGYH
jgi:hypothetical protein